ncbi:fimbrial biogenesis chaperone [Pseudomonas fluorescens]|uniref:fimbrial biogenesis chaperone n=1 Tax=Pseudomonas fluorescens TaxID=294 RepID=UPI001A9EA621|nr:fimbria/pilus periplasmic chaperone [Pseudomonas fluorescens]QTD31490.1 fimbria/pilus periplasmic chaperone [Pseudomonas fluorescens]
MSGNKCICFAAWLILTSLTCSQAMAGVVITGTRLLYPAGQKELTVKLNNNSVRPALVQAWVDTGDPHSTPTNARAPFVLSPPVSRINPGKGQSLRLIFTGAQLPDNRESVFWLNVLDIPPKPDSPADANLLQMAFRSRIKIFYRPQGLPGTAADAPQQLHWSVVSKDQGYALQAFNPTAFHVSEVDLALVAGNQRHESENGMVAPGETRLFALPTLKSMPGAGAQVELNAVNDFGAFIPLKQSLRP